MMQISTSLTERERARRESQKQWNANPCGALPTEVFDNCVHGFGVLHRLPDGVRVVEEAYRVLRRGGTLLTIVHHKQSIHMAAVLARSFAIRTLPRHGADAFVAQIESGADGVLIKPYVRLYSEREWETAVAGRGGGN